MRLQRAGSVILLVLIGLSTVVRADDNSIARDLADRLRQSKTTNDLSGFRIGVKVENGIVWMKGQVNDQSQREHALNLARRIEGVKLVVNDLTVAGATEAPPREQQVQPVSAEVPLMEAPPVAETEPIPMPSRSQPTIAQRNAPRVPVQQIPTRAPDRRRMARAGSPVPVGHYGQRVRPVQYMANGMGCPGADCNSVDYGSGMGTPMPDSSYGGGYGGGGGGVSYESPQMPGHAWPSYASYPNYGAVTYPKQYSPNAWPYIGPFYPYPQVPLGWRKVCLEWDDGWWFLDFKSK